MDETHSPIEIYADDSVINGGMAAVPKMLLHFARHLDCAGQVLNDRQVLLMTMVIALREDRNLRLSNLPMTAALSTLESDLGFLRKAGLVFTQRDYYPSQGGKPPRMRSQIWDIRSLTANLAQVQRLWFRRQAQLIQEWHEAGDRAPRPVYELPKNFGHKVVVPLAVLTDIAAGRFFPVPTCWAQMAMQQRVQTATFIFTGISMETQPQPTSSITGDRVFELAPTNPLTGGRLPERAPTLSLSGDRSLPTASNTGGHLLTPLLLSEEQSLKFDEKIFAHFATRLTRPYSPTGNDHRATLTLRSEGYSLEEIIAAIDEAFARGVTPKRFAYCARIVRDRPPVRPPVPSSSLNSPDLVVAQPSLPPEVERFVKLLAKGDEDQLRRQFEIMAETCDAAARKEGSLGWTWLQQALTRSLGKANPLTYAGAILRNWATQGSKADPPSESTSPAPRARPVYQRTASTATCWEEAIDA
jgi:hypothetical protein